MKKPVIVNFRVASVDFYLEAPSMRFANLFEDQPYNLQINFRIEKLNKQKHVHPEYGIILQESQKTLGATISGNNLVISGRIEDLLKKNYNRQFGLFGNKGLVTKFICHTLEKCHSTSILHAAAVIHPIKNRILIALGPSGSGKSVFTMNALRIGWQLLSTEQVLIKNPGVIFKGNYLDNASPQALPFIKKYLKKAKIHPYRTLKEPIGQKHLVDFSAYQAKAQDMQLKDYEVYLLLPRFGNIKEKHPSRTIKDRDFLLRVLQQVSSDKLIQVNVLQNTLIDICLNGSVSTRKAVIDDLTRNAISKTMLCGNMDDFQQFAEDIYEK